MADRKGFRRGFLLGTTNKTKKKVTPTVKKVSSALLDLEDASPSVFAVATHDPTPESFVVSELDRRPSEKPLFTEIKTSRTPAVFVQRPDLLGEVRGREDTTNILLTPSSPKVESKSQSPETRPSWLLAEEEEEESQPESPVISEIRHSGVEQDSGDIVEEFEMRIGEKLDRILCNCILQAVSKRDYVWDVILDGELSIAKLRLAFCVSQQGMDPLISSLRELGSKADRHRTMRCLAIIEFRIQQERVSADLVERMLPEIGRIAVSESERTRLVQQAMEIAIKLISAASLVGAHDPDIAKVLHNRLSTVDQLLDTQIAWLGSDKKWSTADGARRWCKHLVIAHWQNINTNYRDSGKDTLWCSELQGLEKQHKSFASFASTLLPTSEFLIDDFIVFLHEPPERSELQFEAHLTGFLAWLGRKRTTVSSEQRDKSGLVEKLLLGYLDPTQKLIPLVAALNALWAHAGFVPMDVLHMSIPCKGLPYSLERIIGLVTRTNTDPDHGLIRNFALNILFHSASMIGPALMEHLVDLGIDSYFVQDLSTRLLEHEKEPFTQ